MNKIQLHNGIRVIYEYKPGNLTSFCIGFDAGALRDGENTGLAHVVEHMLFKGTKKRNEFEINVVCDEVFGFHNAMTNYPYAIYYGTTLSSDFETGFEIYADLLLHPTFPQDGFKEEIDIICEELREWKDDPVQCCEDELFYHAYEKRRIKDLIIGKEEIVRRISLQDIKDFYERFYCPENCVITVATSLSFEQITEVIQIYFGQWEKLFHENMEIHYEENKGSTFTTGKKDMQGAKVQYCYSIHHLNEQERKALFVFNAAFGEGVSSILFDAVRTKNGLAYEVGSTVKGEAGIALFTISLGTSADKIENAIEIVNKCIYDIKENCSLFTEERITSLARSIKLKRALKLERSIEVAKALTTYEIMFEGAEKAYGEVENLEKITPKEIQQLVSKLLTVPSIQILCSEDTLSKNNK